MNLSQTEGLVCDSHPDGRAGGAVTLRLEVEFSEFDERASVTDSFAFLTERGWQRDNNGKRWFFCVATADLQAAADVCWQFTCMVSGEDCRSVLASRGHSIKYSAFLCYQTKSGHDAFASFSFTPQAMEHPEFQQKCNEFMDVTRRICGIKEKTMAPSGYLFPMQPLTRILQ